MNEPPAHDSLPYIDPPPSPDSLAHATKLITTEQQSLPAPTLRPIPPPTFTPAQATQLSRIASSEAGIPLPLSRYEAQEPPREGRVRPALEAAYVSAVYLDARTRNLRLLEENGARAWLLHNHRLEGLVAGLEARRDAVAADIDVVNAARRDGQKAAEAELDALEGEWKREIGRVLETEMDVCRLEAEVRRRRRVVAAAAMGQQSETPR